MGDSPQDDQIFKFVSIISWLMLAITGWMSLGIPDLEFTYADGYKIKTAKYWLFWLYGIISTNKFKSDIPLDFHFVLAYMICLLTLLFILCMSFFANKNEGVTSGMLGNLSKFHFVPILCVSALFIIGEAYDDEEGFKGASYFFSLFFGVVALCSLIFIYLKTNIESPTYATWIIKHGAYGCLIALLTHHVGYAFTIYGIYEKDKDDDKDIYDWYKGCYIAFAILIGIANFAISFFLKEVVIPFINLLIYIGMTVQFYRINKDWRKYIYGDAPGIINIIVMVFSLLMVGFLGMRMRQS